MIGEIMQEETGPSVKRAKLGVWDTATFNSVLAASVNSGKNDSIVLISTLGAMPPWRSRIPTEQQFKDFWEWITVFKKNSNELIPPFPPLLLFGPYEKLDMSVIPVWYISLLKEYLSTTPTDILQKHYPVTLSVDERDSTSDEREQKVEEEEKKEEKGKEQEKESQEPPSPPQPSWKMNAKETSEAVEPDQTTVVQFINECDVYFATYRHLTVKRPAFPKYYYGKEKLVPKFFSARDQKTFDDPEVSEEEKAELVPSSDIPDWFRKLGTADKRKRERDRIEGKYPAIETTSLRDPTKEQFMEWWNQIKEYHRAENDILPPRFPKYPFTISGAVSKKYGFTVKDGKKIYKNSPNWWYRLKEEWRKEREEAQEINLKNKNRILPLKPCEMPSNLSYKEAIKKIQERQAEIDQVIAIGKDKKYRHWKLKTSLPINSKPQTSPLSTRPIAVSKLNPPKKSTTLPMSQIKSTFPGARISPASNKSLKFMPVSPVICTMERHRLFSNDGTAIKPVFSSLTPSKSPATPGMSPPLQLSATALEDVFSHTSNSSVLNCITFYMSMGYSKDRGKNREEIFKFTKEYFKSISSNAKLVQKLAKKESSNEEEEVFLEELIVECLRLRVQQEPKSNAQPEEDVMIIEPETQGIVFTKLDLKLCLRALLKQIVLLTLKSQVYEKQHLLTDITVPVIRNIKLLLEEISNGGYTLNEYVVTKGSSKMHVEIRGIENISLTEEDRACLILDSIIVTPNLFQILTFVIVQGCPCLQFLSYEKVFEKDYLDAMLTYRHHSKTYFVIFFPTVPKKMRHSVIVIDIGQRQVLCFDPTKSGKIVFIEEGHSIVLGKLIHIIQSTIAKILPLRDNENRQWTFPTIANRAKYVESPFFPKDLKASNHMFWNLNYVEYLSNTGSVYKINKDIAEYMIELRQRYSKLIESVKKH